MCWVQMDSSPRTSDPTRPAASRPSELSTWPSVGGSDRKWWPGTGYFLSEAPTPRPHPRHPANRRRPAVRPTEAELGGLRGRAGRAGPGWAGLGGAGLGVGGLGGRAGRGRAGRGRAGRGADRTGPGCAGGRAWAEAGLGRGRAPGRLGRWDLGGRAGRATGPDGGRRSGPGPGPRAGRWGLGQELVACDWLFPVSGPVVLAQVPRAGRREQQTAARGKSEGLSRNQARKALSRAAVPDRCSCIARRAASGSSARMASTIA